MNIECSFLATIRAAPNNAALGLVSTRWLEEKNDPRGIEPSSYFWDLQPSSAN
jgi:hypothetical protein